MVNRLYAFLAQVLHYILRGVSRKYLQQKPRCELLEYQSPVLSHSFGKARHTICSGIGVGVYQGEARVFYPLIGKPARRQYWVSNSLRRLHLHHIQMGVVKQLRCLACQIEYSLQFDLSQQDLQKIIVIEPKSECHQETYTPQALSPSIASKDDNDAIQNIQEGKPEETQEPPLSQMPPPKLECPYWSGQSVEECPYGDFRRAISG
ncbi:hypothetical protein ACFLV4_06105 [Chloroflexota bacterium]